jgi:uncharacterized protein (DUF849 family)
MNRNVMITCAVTGAGDTAQKHPALPITPLQIATATIEAAKAGAAIVHIHVRDPANGKPSRDTALYREVVDRIRSSSTDVIINLTGGMGGDWIPAEADPKYAHADSDVVGPEERLVHVSQLLPEICSLDCGSLNFGDSTVVYVNPPSYLRVMAARAKTLGVKPELEVFELGHLRFAKQLIKEGLVDQPPLFQICLGIPWGAPADSSTMKYFVDSLPVGSIWAGFGISRQQMPMAAQSILFGGHVRVGLEDNLYLDNRTFASNAQLVERAMNIVSALGGSVLSASDVRTSLNLRKR